jgi:hypothetical protein
MFLAKIHEYILPLDSIYFRVIGDCGHYKAYIILRITRGATVWATACALMGLPLL